MQVRPLGQSGIQASVVGLGTWAIGGTWWGGTDEKDSIDAIRAGIDAGVNLIDTAPMYGPETSEILVGKAIAPYRDRVVLATKCGLVMGGSDGELFFTMGDTPVYRLLRPDSIRRELESSLRRLQTDHIDLYQSHWQETTTPIEDTMAGLMALKDEGKIRTIGVSNAQVSHLEGYHAAGPLDSAQEKYSMIDRRLEEAVLPYCREHDIAVLAYSPLELGLLTGKMTPEREFNEGDQRKGNPKFGPENVSKINAMLQEFAPIADAHSVTIAQLVIAWTVHQPGLTHALVGARNPKQALENAKAGDVRLSESELATMGEAVARHQ